MGFRVLGFFTLNPIVLASKRGLARLAAKHGGAKHVYAVEAVPRIFEEVFLPCSSLLSFKKPEL